MSELGKQAEEYARMGWYVFPLKPRDKTPLTTHGLNDATTKIETVRGWWGKVPQANIGLNCGKSGLVAIDLDKRGEHDGLSELEAIAQKHGLQLQTAVSLTGGRGRHFIFIIPSPHRHRPPDPRAGSRAGIHAQRRLLPARAADVDCRGPRLRGESVHLVRRAGHAQEYAAVGYGHERCRWLPLVETTRQSPERAVDLPRDGHVAGL